MIRTLLLAIAFVGAPVSAAEPAATVAGSKSTRSA